MTDYSNAAEEFKEILIADFLKKIRGFPEVKS